MSHDTDGIRKLIVAGNGALAWITAAALLRAFGFRKLDVWVVDTGTSRDTRVGRWTLPSQRGMHGLLGVAEPHFIQATGATFKLATEHLGWQGDRSHFLHAHGEIGADIQGTPFYKYLQGEVLAGRAARPELFSVAGTAALLAKFARPTGDKGLTSSFTYGFHIEDAAYTRYMRALALELECAPALRRWPRWCAANTAICANCAWPTGLRFVPTCTSTARGPRRA